MRQLLAEFGKASERDQPAQAAVRCAVAMALHAGSGTCEVLRCLLEGRRWLRGTEAAKAAGMGDISQARNRLGKAPLRRLCEQVVQPAAKLWAAPVPMSFAVPTSQPQRRGPGPLDLAKAAMGWSLP